MSNESEPTSIEAAAVPSNQPAGTSERFRADCSSDITFQSSDGIHFHLHTKYLKIGTAGFPLPTPTRDYTNDASEVIPLTEAASTLEILFQFCYPEHHPDLKGMRFNDLMSLAIAAEKYKVFSAMYICSIWMSSYGDVPNYGLDIFIYAANGGYPDLMEATARAAAVEMSMGDILSKIPAELALPWAMYHEQWYRVVRDAISYPSTTGDENICKHRKGSVCDRCILDLNTEKSVMDHLVSNSGGDLRFLRDLNTVFTLTCHANDQSYYLGWRTSIEKNIENIPKFKIGRPSAKSQSKLITYLYNITDSDITIQSSDGVLFHVHKSNLALSSKGFAPSEFETIDEIIHLTEDSTTLDLLFRFCYPVCWPNLKTLDFGVLAALAEAAEKYQICSPMELCKNRMKEFLPRYAGAILTYAIKHSYPDILDIAGPLMIKEPLSDIMALLSPNQMVPWVKYYERWNQVWKDANSQTLRVDCQITAGGGRRCRLCVTRLFPHNLRGGIASLTNLDPVILGVGSCCNRRREKITSWCKLVERDIANIGSLGNFL